MSDYAQLVRTFYELYVAGDSVAAMNMLSADVEWRAPNCLPYGGVYHGRDGVATYAATAASHYDFVTIEIDEAVESGPDRAIVIGQFGGRTRNTQTDFKVPFCQIWTFRDGQGSDLEYWNDSGAVLRALGMTPAAAT